MTHILVLLLALLIGVVAGLRAMTPPAVVAWAAFLQWINLSGHWLHWVASPITVTILTILLVLELITDQLPKTPSRKIPMQFVARLISGGFAGAVLGTAWGYTWSALGAGVIGAVLGTLGGAEARSFLSTKIGAVPAGIVEDVVAVVGGFGVAAIVAAL